MATAKRTQPATHPTVHVGLALAAVGFLLALYAYTGTRIYDVRFAFVALSGALLAFGGIFTAAWGRAIAASRAARKRRTLLHDDAAKAGEAIVHPPPPTVAAPESKKRFDLSRWVPRRPRKAPQEIPPEGAPEAAPAAKGKGGGAFAFRRRGASPPPPPPPEPAPSEERLTVRCPRCATEFTVQGVRPIPIECPSCGLSGAV